MQFELACCEDEMRGKVVFWKNNREEPFKSFGFLLPDGCVNYTRADTVYFNAASARFSPVRCGQKVEFTLMHEFYEGMRSLAAFKVEKIDDETEQHEEDRPQ